MRVTASVWLGSLALISACGYYHGFTARDRLGIRSVAVLTVQNDTYRQGLDVQLTRRLGQDLSQFTGLVPGDPQSADARLIVRLREVTGRPITEAGGGSILEGAILLAAEVRLVDRRTGATLYEGKHKDWAEFRTTVGEDFADALAESAADLSRKILMGIDARFTAR